MTVTIIITARNYGQFLAECIESCLLQTVACQVVYSDDCSDDDSVQVAKQYRQVEVLAHPQHIGVAAARNAGANVYNSTYLLFVDGDDVLRADYVERHLDVMDEGVPFVYGGYQCFGKSKKYYDPPQWAEQSIWHHNFCNSSSLVNANMFWKAGAWQETPHHTTWDWHLFIRMSRLGTPRKSTATLMYRKHGASNRDKLSYDRQENVRDVRQDVVKLTVGLVYSGRLAELLTEWMDALVRDTEVLKHLPELIIVNNSGEAMPELSAWEDAFSGIRVVKGNVLTWANERERGVKAAKLIAESFNVIQQLATGDIIHTREDDNITEVGSFKKLFDFLTFGIPVRAAVAAIYQNRHTKRPVGGHFAGMRANNMSDVVQKRPIRVDYTGTGCLLYWKDQAPNYFSPMLGDTAAHDWRWGHDLKQMGMELWMLPDAVCRHYVNATEYVLPSGAINGQNNHTRITR
jgi:glycosyltransferase involved in cell wall biosynthesis